MGQFSWLDCENEERQILDNVVEDIYVLVPEEFGGGHILETCYDGYGVFGGYDIYDLVAHWNREYLSKHPEYIIPFKGRKINEYKWYPYYSDLSLSNEKVVKKWREKEENEYYEWRIIGIDLACYDEDNATLPYPIKITHNKEAIYEECEPSLSDPNQGWKMDDDEEEDWI